MSEPAAKPRYLGDSRNVFDLEEIERRMRESIEPAKPQQEPDPLAELARLVGQTNNDAFSRIFAEQHPAAQPSLITEPPPVSMRDPHYPPIFDVNAEPRSDENLYAQHAAYEPQHAYQSPERQAHDYQAHDYQAHDYQPHDAHAYADPYAAQAAYGQEDAYAQPGADWQGYYKAEAYQEPPRRAGRAKLLIGAAVVIAVGGSAAAFMFKGPSATTREAPTILANAGPTKVQPAEPASDGPKQSISILERGGASSPAQSKVVQNEEQPVDVSATARVSGSRPARAPDAGGPVTLAPPAPPPVANSLFAEPKRVKAVAVRPDGTIIDQGSSAPAAPTRAEAPVSAPATPAPPPAPVSRPTDIASLVGSATPSTTPGSGQRTASRAPEPKPAPKPAATPATTASIAAPTGAGGAFSVQLAGTTSAEEAKDAVERLSRKYASELGGYRPSVIKADVGSKTVYRVRVKGLSSDDANTLCARLKAGGGSCFVARN